MNRRNRIIVSIVGIFIVLIGLFSVTFGYYVTRVQGNSKSQSISLTTDDLSIEYSDGTTDLLTNDNALRPSVGTSLNDAIGSKTFTVTNPGEATVSYAVIIDRVSITNASSGSTTTFNSNDFRYTLTCVKRDGTSCSGVNDLSEFPINGGIMLDTYILKGDIHTYTLTMWYIDTGLDQSVDMGKTYQARINIQSSKKIFENPFETGNTEVDSSKLAYNIINNAINVKNGTNIISSPNTSVLAVSARDESIISTTSDDLGTTYYFRGNTKDNYVTFANMCWRIVRIAGDNSIKLILEDRDEVCNSRMDGNWDITITTDNARKEGYFGQEKVEVDDKVIYLIKYLNTDNTAINYEYSMATAFKNFQTGPLSSYIGKLKAGDWCLDDEAYYGSYTATAIPLTKDEKISSVSGYNYMSYIEANGNDQPRLKCFGTIMDKFGDNTTDMYVATLTVDEMRLAGLSNSANLYNYLINNYQKSGKTFWTLTPSHHSGLYDYVYTVSYNGAFSYDDLSNGGRLFRPSVSLLPDTTITGGDGTLENPYIVN